MMHRPIEGTLTVARFKRSLLGQSVYDEVAVRRMDGSHEKFDNVVVSDELRDALVPGASGRFYFHDIAGTRGMHGFKPAGGAARMIFPVLHERIFAAFGALNLTLAIGLMLMGGELRLLPLLVGVLAMTGWVIYRASRQAIIHDSEHDISLLQRALEPDRLRSKRLALRPTA